MTYQSRLEVAFTTAPLAAAPAWRDITNYLLAGGGKRVNIAYGRADEFSTVQPSALDLVLDNSDGRFTPDNTASPYYPNIKKGRRIRFGLRDFTGVNPTNPGNFVSNPGAEVNTTGWSPFNGTLARVTGAGTFRSGVAAFRVTTIGSAGTGLRNSTSRIPIVQGRTYAASFYVKSAAASGIQFYATIVWLDAAGAEVSPRANGTPVTVNTSSFTRVVVSGTAPVGATQAEIRCDNDTSLNNTQFYFDDIMFDEGTVNGTFTTTAPDIKWRFDGFVDQWPHQWVGAAATYAEAQLRATDRLARLGKLASMKSIVETEVMLDGPVAYWTLGDGQDATTAGSSTGEADLSPGQRGSGGTIVFGQGTGPGTDGMGAPVFTAVDATNGKFLYCDLFDNTYFNTGSAGWAVECWFNTSVSGRDNILLYWEADLRLNSTGKLVYRNNGSDYLITTASYNDGLTHHVVVSRDAGSNTVRIYVDGSQVIFGTLTGGHTPLVEQFVVGLNGVASPASGCFTGTIAHVAIYDKALAAARVAEHHLAGTTAFEGDSSDERVARLATYAGVSSTSLDAGLTTSMTALQPQGKAPLALLREAENTEAGVLFFNRTGQLAFHSRSRRYNPVVAATFNCSLGQIGQDLTFVLDDFGLMNDYTVSQPDGSTIRKQDLTSIADYDRYAKSEEIQTTSVNELTDRANWQIGQYGTPKTRCPLVPVDLLTQPSLVASVLALDISSLIELTNLPVQAPAATMELFIEGYRESWSLEDWTIVFNCSPVDQSAAWVLGSSTLSKLGQTTKLAY